jgi:beta-phosphoglucomutase-like phosphatase (HAD superfamily)
MNPKPLKAAIFDVDGTLIDSVDFPARAWVEGGGCSGRLSQTKQHPGELRNDIPSADG